jgi:antitoxin ParD1/3/4
MTFLIGGGGMTTIRKTITLTGQQGDWVKSRIASGDFTNDSEYIRDLIRQDQARSSGLEQLRAALLDGEQSGVSNRTPQEIRQAARERLEKDAKLQAQ